MTIKLGGLSGTLLTLAFFAAKVTGYIDWPWVWVFAPLWIPFALCLLVLCIWLFLVALAAVTTAWTDRPRHYRP